MTLANFLDLYDTNRLEGCVTPSQLSSKAANGSPASLMCKSSSRRASAGGDLKCGHQVVELFLSVGMLIIRTTVDALHHALLNRVARVACGPLHSGACGNGATAQASDEVEDVLHAAAAGLLLAATCGARGAAKSSAMAGGKLAAARRKQGVAIFLELE
eukprot:CAMPEP_0183438204 /NCGR_PEP_ID=MMETSP0370-20130417/76719_1 /TAXON_ID=268820 /ORGANISM="Peridinium aciculiferum, Strain PAER-2" /LENGTH=158 /DNA_ID=CAMNT_0025626357 /DNA_START=62 /DNA_END=537 /DNA_ORIENTATION=-